jgi:sulfur-oxidizing protein SoxY
MNRRTLLKRTFALSAVSVAASAGLLTPGQVLAAYPKAAFAAKDVASGLSAALGSSAYEHSDGIEIKAPDIAENGSVVPVTVEVSGMNSVDSISILADANGTPLVATFDVSAAEPFISTRIKMGKTGNVLAVVKSGGKLYANKKEVKVTIGGCGG